MSGGAEGERGRVIGEPAAEACRTEDEHCITCGDEAIAMRVLDSSGALAVCTDAHGQRHEVAIDLVGPVHAGDEVLVHAGVAISQLEVAA